MVVAVPEVADPFSVHCRGRPLVRDAVPDREPVEVHRDRGVDDLGTCSRQGVERGRNGVVDAGLARPADEYFESGSAGAQAGFDPDQMVVFEDNNIYELEDPVPFETKYP